MSCTIFRHRVWFYRVVIQSGHISYDGALNWAVQPRLNTLSTLLAGPARIECLLTTDLQPIFFQRVLTRKFCNILKKGMTCKRYFLVVIHNLWTVRTLLCILYAGNGRNGVLKVPYLHFYWSTHLPASRSDRIPFRALLPLSRYTTSGLGMGLVA